MSSLFPSHKPRYKPSSKTSPLPLFINPLRLCHTDFLSGAVFAVGLATLALDVACIVMRAYLYGWISTWARDADVMNQLTGPPLEGLGFAILASCFWYALMLCLTADICICLCMPSRDLQEGAIVIYGIVCAFQIPLMVAYLMYELGEANSTWLQAACLITATTSSITTSLAQSHCQTWYLTLRATSIIPSIVSSILHLLLFLLSLHYIHVRSNASLKVYIPKKNRKNKKKQMRQAKPISSNMPFVPSPHAPSMGGTPLTTPAMYYESSSPPVSSPDVSEDEKTPLPPPSYRSKKSSTSSSTKKSRPSPSSVPTPGPTPSLFGPPPAPPSEGDYPLSPRALSKGIPAGTSVFDLARRSEAGSTGSRRTREVAAYDSPRSASTRQEVQSDSGESEEGLSSGEEESVLSRRSSGHGRRDSRGGV